MLLASQMKTMAQQEGQEVEGKKGRGGGVAADRNLKFPCKNSITDRFYIFCHTHVIINASAMLRAELFVTTTDY